MNDQILIAANLYAEGVKNVTERREQWLEKHKELKARLMEIAAYLNANATYKQGFFVDILHAFDEEMNGTSANMPSVTFRSGSMPMLVTFRNSMGEKKGYAEDGFHISFNPTITGSVVVLLLPHHSDLNKEPAQFMTLSVFEQPSEITMEIADQIIARGIEIAFYSSFTPLIDKYETKDNPDCVQPDVIGSL